MRVMKLLKTICLSCILALGIFSSMLSYAGNQLININTATAEQLATGLAGVGAKKAEAIVQLRESLGGFVDKEQLLLVKGIGETTLERNRENIVLQDRVES